MDSITPAPVMQQAPTRTHTMFMVQSGQGFLCPLSDEAHDAVMQHLNAGVHFVSVNFPEEDAVMSFRADKIVAVKRMTAEAAEEIIAGQNRAQAAAALGLGRR